MSDGQVGPMGNGVHTIVSHPTAVHLEEMSAPSPE
jgi:hypothetical protein